MVEDVRDNREKLENESEIFTEIQQFTSVTLTWDSTVVYCETPKLEKPEDYDEGEAPDEEVVS